MKKKKIILTNIFKISVLFFVISLLMWNCEKENYNSHEELQKWKVNDISRKSLESKTDFNFFLKNLNENKNLKSKSTSNDIYNFTIDYSTIREIALENKTSYTFKVNRENYSKDYFENLVVISIENKIEKAYLLKYTPTKQTEYIESHNTITFEGNVGLTELNIDNLDFNYDSKGVVCADIWVPYCNQDFIHVAGVDCWIQQAKHNDNRIFHVLETICENDGFLEPPIAPNQGGINSSGGPANNSDGTDAAIPTTPINNAEKCENPPKGDLNGDCKQQEFEKCMISGINTNLFNNLNYSYQSLIQNFINENDCNDLTKNFVNLAMEAIESGYEVDWDDKVILDNTFINNQRLKCVYDKFKKSNNSISNYLNNFLKDKAVGHLNFKTDSDFSINHPNYASAGALTLPPINGANNSAVNNFNIDIIFNTDPRLPNSNEQNSPTIILAIELIHEMIHAEIFRKLLSSAQQPHVNFQQYSGEQWKNFIYNLKNDYEGLFTYYTRYFFNNSNPTSPQHNLIASHYREMIKIAVKEFDNNQHSEEFYDALSWIGLKNTVAWNNNPNQLSINTIINNANSNETKNCTN